MLGETIKTLRKEKGYSQQGFAKKLNLNNPYYNCIENDKQEPSIPTLRNICKHLDINIHILFIMSLKREDVPEEKRKQYDFIMPSILEMAMSLVD